MRALIRRLRHDERGVTSVFIALLLPGLVLLAALMVDSANWWVHKRHLQIQADAAAFAGAGKFQPLNCNDATIIEEARRYSGDRATDYNLQVGGVDPAKVSMTLAAGAPSPCTSKAVDVTVRENDVPLLIKLLGFSGINLDNDARVEINQIDDFTGNVPILLEDDNAKWVRFSMVDEETGDALGEVSDDTPSATGVFDASLAGVPMNRSNIGVRVAIGYSGSSPSDSCSSFRVDCLDGETGSKGLSHIHTYPQPLLPVLVASPPALKKAFLTPSGATCTNTDAYAGAAGCRVTVNADIDFVSGLNLNDDVDVTATVGTQALTLKRGTGGIWVSTTTALMPAAGGPADVKLRFEQRAKAVSATRDCGDGRTVKGTKNPDPCTGVFKSGAALATVTSDPSTATAIHRTFGLAAPAASSIRFFHVGDVANGSGANAFAQCGAVVLPDCVRTFHFSIGLPTGLKVGERVPALTDPSNKGLLECGSQGNPENEIALGCSTRFELYNGPSCDTRNSPQPWNCAEGKTGQVASAIEKGMRRRIYYAGATQNGNNVGNADCLAHPNFYAPGSGKDPKIDPPPDGDTRVISVILGRRGSTDAQGSTLFPIVDVATIYVTGFSNQDPCSSTAAKNEVAVSGGLVGYFIKYKLPGDGAVYGTQQCATADLGGCVAVLTR